MKALSVRTPWWWYILHGGKDIENRSWPTNFRGRVYIHAGKWFQGEEVLEDYREACEIARKSGWKGSIPSPNEMRRSSGCLVGSVEIVGCVKDSISPWFFGKYGFVLQNPVAFEMPIPCKGALSFFELPGTTQ